MEEEVIIVIKPRRAAIAQQPAEVHTFDSPEEAYLFLGERNDRKPGIGHKD